jgi:hypothetical protein
LSSLRFIFLTGMHLLMLSRRTTDGFFSMIEKIFPDAGEIFSQSAPFERRFAAIP